MKRKLHWLIFNGGIVAAAVLWLTYGNEFAGNALKFIVWVSFIISLLTVSEDIQKTLQETGRPVHRTICNGIDIGLCLFLASYGHFVLAGVYLIHMILINYGYDHESK